MLLMLSFVWLVDAVVEHCNICHGLALLWFKINASSKVTIQDPPFRHPCLVSFIKGDLKLSQAFFLSSLKRKNADYERTKRVM